MTTINTATYPKIPLTAGEVQGWKAIPIKTDGVHDPLVPLGPLSQEAGTVMTSAIYFGEHSNSPYIEQAHQLTGTLLTLFARQSVARRLVAAEQHLPAGHHLLVFDAYRPYQVQQSLYNFYKQKLHEKYPSMDEAELESETQNYVSLPSTDPTRPAPHSTGGAIDLVIIKLSPTYEEELQHIRTQLASTRLDISERVDLEARLSALIQRHGKMLDFGTAFDHGGEKSALAYYESRIADGQTLSDSDMQACNNRRLLYSVMTEAGFQPYFAEWWHFNAPESQMGAAVAGLDHATFEAATLEESNQAHEDNRRKIREQALRATDAPNIAADWPAEIIAPSEI